ncbi:hypothetical protein C0J52_22815 [Blattella germanica]|nr:hypothetical protein C0J52_22815 [Blattella germanica]
MFVFDGGKAALEGEIPLLKFHWAPACYLKCSLDSHRVINLLLNTSLPNFLSLLSHKYNAITRLFYKINKRACLPPNSNLLKTGER